MIALYCSLCVGGAVMLLVYEYVSGWLQRNWWWGSSCYSHHAGHGPQHLGLLYSVKFISICVQSISVMETRTFKTHTLPSCPKGKNRYITIIFQTWLILQHCIHKHSSPLQQWHEFFSASGSCLSNIAPHLIPVLIDFSIRSFLGNSHHIFFPLMLGFQWGEHAITVNSHCIATTEALHTQSRLSHTHHSLTVKGNPTVNNNIFSLQ